MSGSLSNHDHREEQAEDESHKQALTHLDEELAIKGPSKYQMPDSSDDANNQSDLQAVP